MNAMLGYTSVMVMLMLLCNLRFGQAAGVVSVLVYSVYGILMQPDTIQLILKLPDEAYYIGTSRMTTSLKCWGSPWL